MIPKKYSFAWALIAFFCGISFIILIGYIDFEIISPMILPEDHCYYHTHPTPYWVELLYMSGGSNGHPDGSIFHFLIVIVLGAILGHVVVRAIRLNLGKDEVGNKLLDS
ncbi:MAG: hypothetical protein AB8B56_02145 [Crocinitomicaceae bacterium]